MPNLDSTPTSLNNCLLSSKFKYFDQMRSQLLLAHPSVGRLTGCIPRVLAQEKTCGQLFPDIIITTSKQYTLAGTILLYGMDFKYSVSLIHYYFNWSSLKWIVFLESCLNCYSFLDLAQKLNSRCCWGKSWILNDIGI